MSDYDQYADNKYRGEKLAQGFVEYASVEIRHFHRSCNCGGANPMCRHVTHREWRKPSPKEGK